VKTQDYTHPLLRSTESFSTNIYWGIITAINSEAHTMSVKVPSFKNKTYDNIPLNMNVTMDGAGIRVMPVPHTTIALLYYDNTYPASFYHIGYFLDGMKQFSSNKTATKTGKILLQRYLEPGEAQLVCSSHNEVYLSKDGSVLIKSGSGQFLKLSEYSDALEGNFSNMDFDLHAVDIQAGKVKRLTGENDSTLPVILRDSNSDPHKEFTINIGTTYDDETGKPEVTADAAYPNRDITPEVGTLSFASQVFKQDGTAEKAISSLSTVIQFLLKITGGLKVTVDEDGELYIANSATDAFVRFKPGRMLDGEEVIDQSEFEIKLRNATFNIKDTGFTYTNQSSDDENITTTITITEDSIATIDLAYDNSGKTNHIVLDDSGFSIKDINDNEIVGTDQDLQVTPTSKLTVTTSQNNGDLKALLNKIMALLQNITNGNSWVGNMGAPLVYTQVGDIVYLSGSGAPGGPSGVSMDGDIKNLVG
jgi:hypothetical protein